MAMFTDKGVTFVRPELEYLIPQYDVIKDCLDGEFVVKLRKEKYLPNPSPIGCDEEEREARYDVYLMRAVFYNATRRTMQGLLGQVFDKKPVIEAPGLEPVLESASGDGVSLEQQSKHTLQSVLAYSRAGLLVDFPPREGSTTKAQIESGEVRPTITSYDATQILNWKVEDVGAQEKLTLLVLREVTERPKLNNSGGVDDFEIEMVYVYRVFRLVDGAVVQQLWAPKGEVGLNGRPTVTWGNQYEIKSSIVMKGKDGSPLSEIPFMFIGTTSNSVKVEAPSFYDLASLNIAHYRNSADYEEGCFLVGQPTVAVTGLNEQWLTGVLGGKITVGSRGGVPLPMGGDLKMVQAQPNTLLREALDSKERQMVAIGARLVEQAAVQRTATEATLDSTVQVSSLQSSTRNVSRAYLWALEKCAELIGVPTDSIQFSLNDDFQISKMTAQERQEVVKSWQAGLISFTEAREVMRKVGIATQKDEEAKLEIDQQKQDDMEFEAAKTEALTDASTVPEPAGGKQSSPA